MRQPKIPGLGRLSRAGEPEPAEEGEGSVLERLLWQQLMELGVPAPDREFVFAWGSRRQWRFDFAWPALKWAVEVDGGIWTRGRHCRPLGFRADCEKLRAATIAGWKVLRYTETEIRNKKAAREIAACLSIGRTAA